MKWSVNSAWFAMSARYSKTSSRGLAIVISVLSGSTGPRSLRGGARPQTDGLPALGVLHDDRALGRRGMAAAAELTHDAPARVEVDALPDERRPATVGAVVAPRLARADALAQELALEVGLGDAEDRSQHGGGVRRPGPRSCRRAPAHGGARRGRL